MVTVNKARQINESSKSHRTTSKTLPGFVNAFKKSIVLLLFVLLWELVPQLGLVERTFLPPFSEVIRTWWELLLNGELWRHFEASILRSIFGFVSVLIGIIFTVQMAILIAGCLLIFIAVISFRLIPETKFISIAREDTSNIQQMKGALKDSLSIIKGNTILLGLAAITLFAGLASEGFDRLWGAHFIEGFKMNEEDAVYWFGAFYAIGYLLNIGLLKIVETYVKERFAIVLVLLNSLLVVTMISFAIAEQFLIAAILYWGIASLRAVNYPLVSAMTNKQLHSQGRATTLSMYGQLDAFGQVAGGPLVGVIALYTSVQGGIIISAVLMIPTVYFLWRLRRIA